MYYNVGRKIQNISKLVFFITMILMILMSIFIGIFLDDFLYNSTGIAVTIAIVSGIIGIILAWVISLFVYGYGKLIESAEETKDIIKKEHNSTDSLRPLVNLRPATLPPDSWQCKKCGRINPNYTGTCACGTTKSENKDLS